MSSDWSTGSGTTGDGPPRVFVHLDHGRSPERWRARYERGEVWEKWPYGYEHARGPVNLAYSKDRAENKLVELARKGIYWVLGFDLVHALRNRRAIATADVIWAHTEHEHLAARLVQKICRLPNVPIIAQSVWLWDLWDGFSPMKRALYRWLLAGPGIHTTHSVLNARKAAAVLPGADVSLLPYGTEPIRLNRQVTDSPAPGVTRVLAPGNDRDRDWTTLIEAARRHPSLEVRILSRRIGAEDVAGVDNVTVARSRSITEMQGHYAWADVVAIPMQPNLHASGATVGLEALNLGVTPVVTDVGGIRDYFGDSASYVAAGDVDALAEALTAAGERPGADRAVLSGQQLIRDRGLTASDYASRHLELTFLLLSGLGKAAKADVLKSVASFSPAPRISGEA